MKLQHLRFFCAVIECRSVTAAAERLHISQPALSSGLKALEDDLGLLLFERTGGRQRIIPSTKALRFYHDASDILSRCDAAKAKVAKPESRPAVARLGVLRTIVSSKVASVLDILMRSPLTAWRPREGNATEIGQWLAQGRIDIGWTTIEKLNSTSEILWTEPFDVLMAKHHKLAQTVAGHIKLSDLTEENVILRTSCELRSGAMQSSGLKLQVVARANRDDLALNLVAQGIGIAIAPRSYANADVVAIPIPEMDLARAIGLRWRPGVSKHLVNRVRATILASGKTPME